MRFTAVILFIAFLFMNLFGFYFAFVFRQYETQKQMAEVMSGKNGQHSVIVLSGSEFNNLVWLKKDKEFRYNGGLYDVGHMEVRNGMVTLYVEQDYKETGLVNDFLSLFNRQNDSCGANHPSKVSLQSFLKEFTFERFVLPVAEIQPGNRILRYEKEFLFSSFIADRQSPPPDISFS